jgi:hypothetical protein
MDIFLSKWGAPKWGFWEFNEAEITAMLSPTEKANIWDRSLHARVA